MADLRGGIDLGGTKIEAIVIDDKQQVLGQARQPTPTEGTPKDVAEQMVEAMRGADKDAGVETSSLQGVGVGCRAWPSTSCLALTTIASILVPPRSIPPRSCSFALVPSMVALRLLHDYTQDSR